MEDTWFPRSGEETGFVIWKSPLAADSNECPGVVSDRWCFIRGCFILSFNKYSLRLQCQLYDSPWGPSGGWNVRALSLWSSHSDGLSLFLSKASSWRESLPEEHILLDAGILESRGGMAGGSSKCPGCSFLKWKKNLWKNLEVKCLHLESMTVATVVSLIILYLGC